MAETNGDTKAATTAEKPMNGNTKIVAEPSTVDGGNDVPSKEAPKTAEASGVVDADVKDVEMPSAEKENEPNAAAGAKESPTETNNKENGHDKASAAPSEAGTDDLEEDEDDVAAEEEDLFRSLEKAKEEDDKLHPNDKPVSAPTLIKAGIQQGEVADDDDDEAKQSGDEKDGGGDIKVSKDILKEKKTVDVFQFLENWV